MTLNSLKFTSIYLKAVIKLFLYILVPFSPKFFHYIIHVGYSISSYKNLINVYVESSNWFNDFE
jgi:hypothetical protein